MNPSQAGNPAACQLDGRRRGSRRATAGRRRVGVAPRADRARDRDRQRAAPRQLRSARWRAGTRRVRARAGAPGAVERRLPPRRRVPDQPERVAADAAAVGHDDRRGRRSSRSPHRRRSRRPAGRRARPPSRGGAARRPRRATRARAGRAPRAAGRHGPRSRSPVRRRRHRPVPPTSNRCSSRRSRATAG